MKNEKLRMFGFIVIALFIGALIGRVSYANDLKRKAKKLENQVIYTITIDNEFINLRPEIDLDSDVIKKVYKGEQYKAVEYHEGNSYNWYKVIYDEGQTGWLASGKKEPWVIIENN